MKVLNKLKRIILLTIFSAALISCGKDDKPVVFPLKFYGERIEVASATRMYTKDGEIKDQQKIARFTKDLVYFQAENDQSGKGALVVNFLSKEKAIFGESHDSDKFDVIQSGDQFLFTSEMQLIYGPVVQDDFRRHIFKYQSIVSPSPFSGYTSREMHVGYGNYRDIRFPMLSYYTSSGNSSAFFRSGGIANNEFDQAALSYLKSNDTLAVKVYNVICKSR